MIMTQLSDEKLKKLPPKYKQLRFIKRAREQLIQPEASVAWLGVHWVHTQSDHAKTRRSPAVFLADSHAVTSKYL